MGFDYWPFGIEGNKTAITTFFRHLRGQGIIEREPAVTDLFLDVRSTSDKQLNAAAPA
jgi:hypothetical protein